MLLDERGGAVSLAAGPACSEAERIRRARAGDAGELNRLVAELRPMLRAYAQRQLRRELCGRMDASDVVQGALLEAARDLPSFSGTSLAQLRAWLCGILRRNVLDDVKAQVRSKKRAVGLEQQPDEQHRRVASEPRSHRTSPSQYAARREEVGQIIGLVEQLPALQRRVIGMWLDGCAMKEIAAALDRTELAAASQLKRALEQLRSRARAARP